MKHLFLEKVFQIEITVTLVQLILLFEQHPVTIAPTEAVEAPGEVKICASLILTDPTEDVVETPVNGIKFSTRSCK